METPPVSKLQGELFKTFLILKSKAMIELFTELTNHIFWDGYAQQLAIENPAGFQAELAEFINSYNETVAE
jgi:hypothetical protein